MSKIESIITALSEYYGRPLRLLDLCRVSDLQDRVSRINPQEFDVVLGYDLTKSLVDQLISKADALLLVSCVEDASQLDDIPFVRHMGGIEEPSSNMQRSLFYCSSKVWYFNRSVAGFIDSFKESHEYACGTHQGSRSYFLGKDLFAKIYRLNGDRGTINRNEFNCEVSVLKKLADLNSKVLTIPKLIDSEQLDDIAYIVTERIPGRRLTEIIEQDGVYEPVSVVVSVLKQLVEFEKLGLYFNDLRLWNILIDDKDQARLIDFGSVSDKQQDVVWPYNIFASFLIFVAEVQWMKEPRVYPFRRPMFSPVWLRKDLQAFCNKIWSLPHTDWTFGLFDQCLNQVLKDSTKLKAQEHVIPPENLKYWMAVNESLLSLASSFYLYDKVMIRTEEAEEKARHAQAMIQEFEIKAQHAQMIAKEAEAMTQLSEQKAQQAQIIAQEAQVKAQQAQIRFQEVERKAQLLEQEARQSQLTAQEADMRSQKAEMRLRSLEIRRYQLEADFKQAKAIMRQFFQEYCNEELSLFVPITWLFRRRSQPSLSDVVAGYRYFLERNPENELVVLQHLHVGTVGELIAGFKNSQEHKAVIFRRSVSKGPFRFSIFVKKLVGYPFLTLLFLFICYRSKARDKVRKWLKKFPLLARFWQRMDWNQTMMIEHERSVVQLTPRALQIYADLKAAIDDRKKENV